MSSRKLCHLRTEVTLPMTMSKALLTFSQYSDRRSTRVYSNCRAGKHNSKQTKTLTLIGNDLVGKPGVYYHDVGHAPPSVGGYTIFL